MRNRIAAIAIALLVAFIGLITVIGYAHRADARAVAGQEVRTVYIAAKAVPQGTTEKDAVAQGLITPERVVAKGVPVGALAAPAPDASAVVALTDIAVGEVVLAARFGPPSQVRTSSGVPAGRVAVSIGFSNNAAIEPFLKPGSHIAIYDTFNAKGDSGALTPYGAHLNDDKATTRATRVVLPDVEVLSVKVPKNAAGGGSSSPSGGAVLVTVSVAPQDAPRLVHAVQTGDLYAALLGSGASVSAAGSSSDDDVVGR
ncbi:MAG: Flp pilus assembly protein CpaB [Marmoricola sp.]